jgi:ParB-like chromosome segregation protein Spo0J
MMELRPIVIDSNNMVLGGNMRLKALQSLGFKNVPDSWVKRADDLTEEEKKRFIITDNAGFGEWDWDMLANEWNADDLVQWGLDVPVFNPECSDDKEKEKEPIICPHCGNKIPN